MDTQFTTMRISKPVQQEFSKFCKKHRCIVQYETEKALLNHIKENAATQ